MIRFFIWQLLIALDQLVNVIFGGYADETMRQAKLALLQAGLLDEVDAAIAAEATPKAVKIEWEYASEVQRDWVNTLGLAEMLGLSDEQLDNLFVLAASL